MVAANRRCSATWALTSGLYATCDRMTGHDAEHRGRIWQIAWITPSATLLGWAAWA